MNFSKSALKMSLVRHVLLLYESSILLAAVDGSLMKFSDRLASADDGQTAELEGLRNHGLSRDLNSDNSGESDNHHDGDMFEEITTKAASLRSSRKYWIDLEMKNASKAIVADGRNLQSQTWTQRGNDIDGEAEGDLSGWSISLSSDGNVLAVGAYGNNGSSDIAGHVRVYQFASGAWTQRGRDIDGEAPEDWSGYSVSLSCDGSVLAIGAPHNGGKGYVAGHVRVYKYANGAWLQRGGDIDGEARGDRSGYSVSLSSDGSVLAIGAPGNDGNGNISGHVRVYQFTNGAWTQLGRDIDGEAAEDQSGSSVSLSSDGSVVAIGAPLNNGNGSIAGHVRVYQYVNGAWTRRGSDIDGDGGDFSGQSVSLSSDGSVLAIGAPWNNGRQGHVRVFQYASGTWTQRGADIAGEAAGVQSGHSVSLSSDGNMLAVGVDANRGVYSSPGSIRVYQFITGAWIQRGGDIDAEAFDDGSGHSVSLSRDGSVLAIGAPYSDGGGYSAGNVRVYQYPIATKKPTMSPTKKRSRSPTKKPNRSPTKKPLRTPTKKPTK